MCSRQFLHALLLRRLAPPPSCAVELQKLRISGVSFSFNADPIDVYMRWLNLKLFNMLLCGKYEEYFSKYADKQYQGFLDEQIRWNCPPNQIPVGFDRRREFRYFSAAVAPMDQLIQDALYFIPLILFPWPSCFAKHRAVASWQLALRGYRFGGRQPRLGGIFLGEKNWRYVTTRAFIVLEWNHCVTAPAADPPPPTPPPPPAATWPLLRRCAN